MTGQVASPWSTTPVRCEMLTFGLCEFSQEKGRSPEEEEEKKRNNALITQAFPSPASFSSRKASRVFLTTPRFYSTLSPLGLSEFSKTQKKFPEMNPVTGYGRILKCLLTG